MPTRSGGLALALAYAAIRPRASRPTRPPACGLPQRSHPPKSPEVPPCVKECITHNRACVRV
eukprot:4302845-Alexandrium_andersonii.AAC.1